MHFSAKSLELLLDLLEIKMSLMHIHDREDSKELKSMQKAREELLRVAKEMENDQRAKRQRGRESLNV